MTMMGHGLATLLMHVLQCITLRQTKRLSCTLIAEGVLRHFYQRYGFRIIKDFHTDAETRITENISMLSQTHRLMLFKDTNATKPFLVVTLLFTTDGWRQVMICTSI